MGIDFAIIVYTHTDMEDVWPIFFGQFEKYLGNSKVYVALNKKSNKIPHNHPQIIYDDSFPYTDRWKEILSKINEEIFMFIHEDMILFDLPKLQLLNKYYKLVKEHKIESVKMIYVPSQSGPIGDITSNIDNTLITNEFSQLSIQPTIISKKSFISILNSVNSLNIWDFEASIKNDTQSYMVKIGGEKKRGIFHCDSIVFPYIATAISKGKWNTSEYKKELNFLFKEYNINPKERGEI